MASADVDLKIDTSERMRFAHSPWKGLMFTLVSLSFTLLCWFAIQDDDAVRYGFTAFTLLFVLAGVAAIFWRREIDIDLQGRRVLDIQGFWPNPKSTLRNLDDADGIWLNMEYRSSGSKNNRTKVPWWWVSLNFPDQKKGVRLFATRDEVDGYARWEDLAQRLRLSAVDATSDDIVRKHPTELDAPLANQDSQRTTSKWPIQPTDSLAELRHEGAQTSVVLPPIGLNSGLLFLALFGLAFVIMGSAVFLSSIGVLDFEVQGSEWAIRIIPVIFITVGGFIIWLGVRGSFGAWLLGVDNGELYIERLLFGKRSGRESIKLTDIEHIDVAGDVRSRQRQGLHMSIGDLTLEKKRYRVRESEVVVRSDKKILRFGDFLCESDKAWIADLCRFAVHHGSLR